MGGGPTCPGAGGGRSIGVPFGATGWMVAAAGTAFCTGLRNGGAIGRAVAGMVRNAGPGATGRAVVDAGRLNCRATRGVTPMVDAAGCTGGAPTSGRACASCAGSTRCANRETGRELVIALVGTTVAALRLKKLLTVTFRLMVVKLVTWRMLTSRM